MGNILSDAILRKILIWRDKPINFLSSSLTWTLVLIFFCQILTTYISYQSILGLIEQNTKVVHTQEVIEKILSLSENFRAAESRQRGYLLTNDILYMENYYDSLRQVTTYSQELKRLVSNNPKQLADVDALIELIKQRKAIMFKILEIYSQEGHDKGALALKNLEGLESMNAFVNLARKIEGQEKNLLQERVNSSLESRNFALEGLITGALFTTTLVFFCYYLLMKDFQRRRLLTLILTQARDDLEVKVSERTQQLERSNRELQEFAYIASHDLQEPLRKILIFGDRLRQRLGKQLDETGQDYLARMENASKRMQVLIKGLLAFSLVSSDDTALEITTLDLNTLIQEVLSDLEGNAAYNHGYFCIDVLPQIHGNALQIRQTFQNVLSNALKFQRKGIIPKISILWHNQNEMLQPQSKATFIEIAVIDNGIGIDPNYSEKIFLPFKRLHGRSEYEGTGIGLAVCRKIMERHHGYIRAFALSDNYGSMFILGFPVTMTE